MVEESTSQLIDFYRGEAADSEGRTLEEILGWDYIRLELVHDFVQWLFPLDEPSAFNPDAPLLTNDDIAAFRRIPPLRENLMRAFEKMLGFYGFRLSHEPACRSKNRQSSSTVGMCFMADSTTTTCGSLASFAAWRSSALENWPGLSLSASENPTGTAHSRRSRSSIGPTRLLGKVWPWDHERRGRFAGGFRAVRPR